MQVMISALHENAPCAWCEKQTETVTVEFYGGFLQKCPLCFKCLTQAIRVYHRQTAPESAGRSKESGSK